MATRTVTTVFAIQGEGEYKTAIKNINAEIKNLNSAMQLSQERYKDNETSIEALRTKIGNLQDIYAKNAEKVDILDKAYETATKNAEKYREENEKLAKVIADNKTKLEEMATAGQKASEAYEKLEKETAGLEKSYTANDKQITASARNALAFSTQANETRTEMEKLQRVIDETTSEFAEAISPSDGYSESLEEVGKAADDAGDAADGMGKKINTALDATASAIAAAQIEKAFDSVKNVILDCTNASIEFGSAITGVFKTVDGTTEQLNSIKQGIKELSTEIPVSTTEIAGVAEAAGQLGIATDDILDFTEVMIKMGTATNLSSEEAATQLARFANITEMPADDYERLGSTIVDLGNNFATTESEIVEMVMRMASTGDMIGLSADEMLAYATALSSVGIEAEAGGSAISKLFKKLEIAVAESKEAMASEMFEEGVYNPIEQYANVAGILAEEFNALWDSDPAEALKQFLIGLGELEEKGGNAITTLDDMGLSEVRLSNAILALSSSGNLLNEALETSETAWKNNTALTEEAAKRYSTTESKVQLLKNQTELLRIAIGDDFVTAVDPAIEKLTDLTGSLADAAEESPALSSALAGVGGGLAGLTGLTTVAAGIKAISSALGLFGSAAGPVALTVSAITAASSAIAVYVSNSTKLSDAANDFITTNDSLLESVSKSKSTYTESSRAIEENRDTVEKLIEKVVSLTGEMEQTPATKAIVEAAVDELNKLLPNLGLTYDEVTGQINMTRDALIEFADEAANTAKLDALKEYLGDLSGQSLQLEIRDEMASIQIDEARQKYEEATEAVEKFTEGQTWLEKALNYTNPQFVDLKLAAEQAKKELNELTESQQEIQDALGDVNSELEIAQIMYNGYVTGLGDSAETATEAGEKVAVGFAEGLINKPDIIRSATQRMASLVDETLRDELEIHSPSKKAKRLGRYFGEGLALGIEESGDGVSSAMRNLATDFDISDEIVEKFRLAQSKIGDFSPDFNALDNSAYYEMLSQMNGTMGEARAASQNDSSRIADITIVQELDGKVLSREISRVQWADSKITARSRGIR